MIEHNCCVQQTMHAFKQREFDYLHYLLQLIQISCNALQFNQWICFLSALYEWRVVWISTSVLSDLFKWHYYLQQDSERAQATCMMNLAETTRDWFTNRHKQMQVSCVRDHFSRTIDIHRETKDEFSKDTDDCQIIYLHQSHSDTVLHQLLQFLSTLYQEFLEDCSLHDLTYSKENLIWMKSDLSDDVQSYEEVHDQDFNTSSFWLNLWNNSWN